MIVSVDFDNTLALGNYASISMLAPNRLLIHRLNQLRNESNPEIVVVTARGGKNRFNTKDKKRIYTPQIEEWLKKYGVPFDRISFKKEYANLYIDDQTIGPFDFFRSDKSIFTGNTVIFTESTVVKSCKTAPFEHEWYKEARLRGFSVPDVLFCNDECIITKRITEVKSPNADDFIAVLEVLEEMPVKGHEFFTYLDNIPEIEGQSQDAKDCILNLRNLAHPATFFHGDLSTTNVLCDGEKTYLIDPNCKHIFGSYLTDAGKAVFSLIAYEARFEEAQKIVDAFGPDVWHFAVAEGLRVCKYQPKYISIVNNIADLI